jgi:hypothetical protein
VAHRTRLIVAAEGGRNYLRSELMRTFLRLSVLTSLFAIAAATPVSAQNPFTYSITTHDASDSRAWITIQDLGKTRNTDYGYVEKQQSRKWSSGNYLHGSFYYVRFEFKGAGDKTVCDTRMQVRINPNSAGSGAYVYGYYDPKTNKCHEVLGT